MSAFTIGTDVYVACDDLVSFEPNGPGKLVVIDATTDTVRTTIALPVANPQGNFAALADGDLLIAAQTYDSATTEMAGCIARVTPGATPTSSCALTNAQLGGLADHVALAGDTAYVATTSFDFTTSFLQTWDVASATVSGAISAASEQITDVAVCSDGTIVAADQAKAAPGLRIFSGSVETTTAALPIGLPPDDGNQLVCYDR